MTDKPSYEDLLPPDFDDEDDFPAPSRRERAVAAIKNLVATLFIIEAVQSCIGMLPLPSVVEDLGRKIGNAVNGSNGEINSYVLRQMENNKIKIDRSGGKPPDMICRLMEFNTEYAFARLSEKASKDAEALLASARYDEAQAAFARAGEYMRNSKAAPPQYIAQACRRPQTASGTDAERTTPTP